MVIGLPSGKLTSPKSLPAWDCLPSWLLLLTLLARSVASVPTWWAEWPAGGASAQGCPHLRAGPFQSNPASLCPGGWPQGQFQPYDGSSATKPPSRANSSPLGPSLTPETPVGGSLPDLQGRPAQGSLPQCLGHCGVSDQEHHFLFPLSQQSVAGVQCVPPVCRHCVP